MRTEHALAAATDAATDWLRATRPASSGASNPHEEIFGADVFDQRAMRERLPKQTFKALMKTIDEGERLDPESPTSSPRS
jgi:glutamine synthetase